MRTPPNTFQNGRKNNPATVVKLAAKRNGTAKRPLATEAAEVAEGPATAAREDLSLSAIAAADSTPRAANTVISEASGEKIETAMQKWSENVEQVSQAPRAVSHVFQEISREWLGWIKAGTENSQQGFLALIKCRSPREFFEVQARILNQNLELFTASSKRMAAISAEITNNASRKITSAA
jgi:hypothetical protein